VTWGVSRLPHTHWYADGMASPVRPPIAPMLARLVRELPIGHLTYEPKWDGFRCLAFVDADGADLRSRHDRPLGRYFPELVTVFESIFAVRRDRPAGASFVVDGEIVLAGDSSGPGFAGLMARLHPAAARVDRLSQDTPARYIAFDLLADGATDLRDRWFIERRSILEGLLRADDEVLSVTAASRDAAVAQRWLDAPTRGIDGVIAKPDDLRYEAGRRSMVKVKRLRTADCVVAGLRATTDRGVSSLLLGLYDDDGALWHVGSISQLSRSDRISFLRDLAPLAIPLEEHPWREGFTIGASPLGRLPGSAARWTPDMDHDWLPLRVERVVEVGFDQVDGARFRHPARFLRWRPDRTAGSCRLDQISAVRRSPPSDFARQVPMG
jgi:ATP-dependent DNA ligase